MNFEIHLADVWGWIAANGLSLLLAEVSFRNGRLAFRTGFYFCAGNLLISLMMFRAEGGVIGGGLIEAIALMFVSTGIYFAYLGASATFRTPKKIKCFRCQYVGFPSETDESLTKHNERHWNAFRKLDAETKRELASVKDDRCCS